MFFGPTSLIFQISQDFFTFWLSIIHEKLWILGHPNIYISPFILERATEEKAVPQETRPVEHQQAEMPGLPQEAVQPGIRFCNKKNTRLRQMFSFSMNKSFL